jgi:hypothetical protein
MSDVAKGHLPSGLQAQVADPGVYSETGFLGLGAGWYHFGSAGDEVFLGHTGEKDFYILDFGVTVGGEAADQGLDVITEFERHLDGVLPINAFAPITPGVSFSVVAQGFGPHVRYEDGVDYDLVKLEFQGPVAVQTPLADLGGLRFVDLI